MSNAPIYRHLSTLTAPKTSANAQGGIVYAILKDEDSTEIFFTILENQGGSGCFGREVIPFTSIEACLTGHDRTQNIPAKRFLKAFSASKSVNNGGFLAACLRHQGLLQPAPESPQQHVIGGDWSAWVTDMLNSPSGEVFTPHSTEKPPKPMQGADSVVSKKGKKAPAKDKKEVFLTAPAEGDNDDHPD